MPGVTYGTISTLDALASSQQAIAQIGEDVAFQSIEVQRQAHNLIVNSMFAELMERSTDRARRYGGGGGMVMDPVGQFGRADAQKITAGVTVNFPLDAYGISVQWTRKSMEVVTGAQLAAQFIDAQQADLRRIEYQVKVALFNPTNVTTYTDYLVDNVALPLIARLVNADSNAIPSGPNGETFVASSHTHYLGTGSFVAADLAALISAVVEHYANGEPRVYINRASAAAIRGFTGFYAYQPINVQFADTVARGTQTLDQSNLYDQAIGVFDGGSGAAEVWIKPWIPANYVLAIMMGVPPPLVYRTRRSGFGDLQIMADDENYPLRARTMEREFGIAVWNRTAAAVLKTDNATYAAPTLTV